MDQLNDLNAGKLCKQVISSTRAKGQSHIEMIKNNDTQKHPPDAATPCFSNFDIFPRNDVFLRLTLDASNIIQSFFIH